MSDSQRLKQQLWKKMDHSPFVMVGLDGGRMHSEPLTLQLDRDQVDTLFFFGGKIRADEEGTHAHISTTVVSE
jgi:hypothetical protein